MTKTNKSFSKRLKVTKTGKVIARKPGLNHFNAKASRNSKMSKKRTAAFGITKKTKARFLSR